MRQVAEKTKAAVVAKFPKLDDWLSGAEHPTVKQLADFAKAVHIPFGYFFLSELPDLKTGVPLFRTNEVNPTEDYSDELRDTISILQGRQQWLREYLISEGAEPLPFVGSYSHNSNPEKAAKAIRKTLQLEEDWASKVPNWEKALKYLFDKTEDAGIYVTINGVVGNNTHRSLNPDEFRGFALTDEYAPCIFINGKDFTAAKMFTLAHELAHIWLGKSAAFDLRQMLPSGNSVEIICDRIAAEFLVPQEILQANWENLKNHPEPIQEIARRFKVSSIVAARRLLDTGKLNRATFFDFYNNYREVWNSGQLVKKTGKKGGGDFYNTQHYRVGMSFFRQVLIAAKEGKLLYTDAYKLTGLNGKTFSEFEKEF